MPDQVLRGRASPYFRRLPCLKKCWSHGGLNVYDQIHRLGGYVLPQYV